MYSRWIPPSKKISTPTSQPHEPRINSHSSKLASPIPSSAAPTTRIDASSTYARYIPPPKSKPKSPKESQSGSLHAQLTTAQKRKRDDLSHSNSAPRPKKTKEEKKTTSSLSVQSLHEKSDGQHAKAALKDPGVDEDEDNSSSQVKPHELRRKNRDHSYTLGLDESAKALDEVKKYKKLMEKRQKSQRKSEVAESVQPSSDEALLDEVSEVHDLVPLPQPKAASGLFNAPSSESLPSWMGSPIRVSTTASAKFSDLGFGKDACKALNRAGYKEAFAIQAAVIPLLLPSYETGDVVVSAATGSGKTLAYILPMIQMIKGFATTKLRGLIVMPTRELVMQAKHVADACALALAGSDQKHISIATAVGNETLKAEQSKLMNQTVSYDEPRYQIYPAQQNRKWNSDLDVENDFDFGNLFDEELVSSLPNHIVDFASRVDILICTPGRLVEHLKSTAGFTLRNLSWLVIDEADKLLDQSFQQWARIVQEALGPRVARQEVRKIILSATMTKDIGQLSQLRLHRPRFVELESSTAIEASADTSSTLALPKDLLEFGVKVEDDRIKPLYLMELLEREKILSHNVLVADSTDSSSDEESNSDISSSTDSSSKISPILPDDPQSSPTTAKARGVLIFTKSNETAVRLSRLIALLSPASSSRIGTLTSTLPRSTRERTLRSFSSGAVSILVASDLVSRGLDLPNLAHVINYDVPSSLTSYVHRVGRTARAGRKGHAWTFFTETDGRWFWNDIARATTINRERKVDRVNIHKEIFSEIERKRYEDALEELGSEAGSSMRLKE